eukprot:1322831-Rhodomonas_salina.2
MVHDEQHDANVTVPHHWQHELPSHSAAAAALQPMVWAWAAWARRRREGGRVGVGVGVAGGHAGDGARGGLAAVRLALAVENANWAGLRALPLCSGRRTPTSTRPSHRTSSQTSRHLARRHVLLALEAGQGVLRYSGIMVMQNPRVPLGGVHLCTKNESK